MRSLPYVAGAAATVLFAVLPATPAAADGGGGAGGGGGFTIKDPRIAESSGLAASRLHPGIYWTHNDSGDGPYVYAVDSRTGQTVATVTMSGVGAPRDVEAISIGPDGDIYVGDIGDNLDGSWDHVWIYRFPEPKQLRNETVRATQFTVKYADGPRNAEALMVHPKTGRVYIASKNQTKGGLYVGPEKLSTTSTNVFRRIDKVPWVTDGAFSPDGKQLTLRGYLGAETYDWKASGGLGKEHVLNVPFQGQAESVTYTLDGKALMMGSEGAQSKVLRFPVDTPGTTEDGARAPGRKGSSQRVAGDSDDSGHSGITWGGAAVLIALFVVFLGVRRRSGKR
ncbi:WD40 repeat domain-containing protein [Streptomyces sp. NBC_01387]|uniref:WD40 repeat domain-containing protein n=1 Tax=unclassified Streptomyces TaxID=2593676 RepID=UPI00202452B7|nr:MULTISPECIES: WD40 repeat domain-containing protein [unclassified Streptomyces]MCX4550142.1 WD40 repeat domain-containing protein [Streptomyces sp. NBC_01500]WSC21638.1 WD40 repeat domain-containing protein [Streptomyces sp. NBC_01766]WSV55600.1 WD40 repeat domain-containing protein [Streptomyces sp. NBC_01014]